MNLMLKVAGVCIVLMVVGCSEKEFNQPARISELNIESASQDTAGQIQDTEQSGTDSSVTSDDANEGEKELPTLDEVLANPKDPDDEHYAVQEEEIEEVHTIDIPESWKRLSEKQEIWVDFKNKEVVAGGYICLNAGPLEVFICPRQTKEHESVISLHAQSDQVHAALLAIGAETGHPVKWQDNYEPATGTVIEIKLMWKEGENLIERRGQELVRNIRTEKPMAHDWVFGGSITETIPETGESFYYGNSGELVCLSNFSTATMDIPVESSDANEGLLFEANTPMIPDVGTKVYVKFKPKLN